MKPTYITIIIAVIVICFCGIIAQYYHTMPLSEQPAAVRENYEDSSPPKIKRENLIKMFIKNLYFYNSYPKSSRTDAVDIETLYTDVKQNLAWSPDSSFDTLCYQVNIDDTIKNQEVKKRRDKVCLNHNIDRFAQNEERLYPAFDIATIAETVKASTYPDNATFFVDRNKYQVTKNYFTPKAAIYSYDTNKDLIRIMFYNEKSPKVKVNPTYLVLAQPFAFEYENIGTFTLIADVNSTEKQNLLNYYHTAEDNTQRAIYMTTSPNRDPNNNITNILPATSTLESVSKRLSNNKYNNLQIKIFYASLSNQVVPNSIFHCRTIELSAAANESATATFSYTGNKTNFVTNTTVSFQNKVLKLNVDGVDYSNFVSEANQLFTSDKIIRFNAFVALSFNTIRLVVYYKNASAESHVLIKRTALQKQGNVQPNSKVFAFDNQQPITDQPGFKHTTYVPNFMAIAHDLGYTFT